ncbi:hypothetical protein GJV26_26940 [Massilia dura]|uniref:PNPLA domain-containing protein n=1 Tax=Pseudoduganella dura TaxID=321982 RepID=A0A6I3XUA1_9BURK|nr:hypothetical protein [Pseudoduganella dura]MUI16068.1 hypothetical protein [Pseudoduganella dura]GGY09279.1 hypothetical protein GCM10007386_44610 [Pseudoduganella dura]
MLHHPSTSQIIPPVAEPGNERYTPRLTRTAFLAGALNLCLYPVMMTLAGNGILLGLEQARETLVAFGAPDGAGAPDPLASPGYALFVTALAYWAFASWYCARIMLGKRFPHDRLRPCIDDRFADMAGRWLPRLLGLLGVVPITVFFIVATPSPRYWIALAATAATFLAFVVFRRHLPAADAGWHRRDDDPYPRFDTLSRGAVATVLAMFAISFGVLLATVVGRETASRAIGSPALVLIALGSWTLFGSFAMTYLPRSAGWPSFALVPFALAFALSFVNENHFVARGGAPAPRGDRPAFPDDLEAWNAARGPRGTDPIYLVAAAGGASRAAYWTGVVLTNLENRSRLRGREFARNVYAVSGVSGGSLGLAAFVAALAAEQETARDGSGPLAPRPTDFLARDFLAPAVGQMLYSDTIARFLPVPCIACDRSRGLEEAWARDWRRHSPAQAAWFTQPLRAAGKAPAAVPRMMFNTTTVGDGRLVVQSDLRFVPTDAYDIFDDALDTARLTRAGAVHNSARFTYVSPAAAIRHPGGDRVWDYVVDGGYFENSGVAAINAMIGALQGGTAAQQALARQIVVIVIENDPAGSAQWICDPKPQPRSRRLPIAMEASAPPFALYQTRTARAHAQEAEAIRLLGGCPAGRVIELRYPESDHKRPGRFAAGLLDDDPPMSWFLSAASRTRMSTVLCGDGRWDPRDLLEREWQRALGWIERSSARTVTPRGEAFAPADTTLACGKA